MSGWWEPGFSRLEQITDKQGEEARMFHAVTDQRWRHQYKMCQVDRTYPCSDEINRLMRRAPRLCGLPLSNSQLQSNPEEDIKANSRSGPWHKIPGPHYWKLLRSSEGRRGWERVTAKRCLRTHDDWRQCGVLAEILEQKKDIKKNWGFLNVVRVLVGNSI